MNTLGVTGGIGSGKTTVCRMLEELGARVFYADAEAKKLMAEDPEVRAEIEAAFGAESYDDAGDLNRSHLAARIFGNEENVERINRIVHPRVRAAFERERMRAREEGVALLVKEAALVFETGGERHLDAVAVIDAPEEVRIARVTERDRVSRDAVRARMGHQMPTEELRSRADYVIENTGSADELRRQVVALYADVTK